MGLKLKKFNSILRGMVDEITTRTKKVTDFTPGSAIRSILEAVASEIEQAYFKMYSNVTWAIENSIYVAFGFNKRPAGSANGAVTLKFSYPTQNEIRIPSGTKFATHATNGNKSLQYETRKEYLVSVGSLEADIEVFCTEKGTIGNVSTDSIKLMTTVIPGVSEVTNKEPFLTGTEEESTASRKQRFNRYIETLARGTKKAIEYGAKEVEGVEGAWVDDSVPGVVYVYAHDSNGNLSEEMKDKVLQNLENYRSAGIPCIVLPIVKHDLTISISVVVANGYNTPDYQQALQSAVSMFVNSFPVSKSLYVSDLIQFVMNFDDVVVLNVKVDEPVSDFIIPNQEIIRSSSVNVVVSS